MRKLFVALLVAFLPNLQVWAEEDSNRFGICPSAIRLASEVSDLSAPGVTLEDIARLEKRLADGDRAGVYLALYRLTGQEYWLMDAEITSYSGFWGGGTLYANYLIKMENCERYKLTLDEFTTAIARNLLQMVKDNVLLGGRGLVDPAQLLLEGDGGIWEKNNLGDVFPGHCLYLDTLKFGFEHLHRVFSRGSLYCMRTLASGGSYGKRPSEYAGNENYEIFKSDSGRFVTVLDRRTCRVEAFWDRDTKFMGMSQQIPDKPFTPADPEWHERLYLWEFLQANMDSRR